MTDEELVEDESVSPTLRALAPKVKKKKKPKLSPEVVTAEANAMLDAKALYMRFVPVTKISQVTGISISRISKEVYSEGGWKTQRDVVQAEVNEAIKQSLLVRLKRTAETNLELIEAGLQSFKEECVKFSAAPTLEETELLVRVFEKLNRAKSIEEDTAGAAKEMGSLMPSEILKAFADDPYMGHALAEAKSLPAANSEGEVEALDAPELEDREQSNFDSDIQRHITG